jgi:hypothetical protein
MNRAAIFTLVLAVLLLGPAASAQAETVTQLPFASNSGAWLAVDPSGSHVFVSGGAGTSSIVVLNYSGQIVKTITGEGGASQMAVDTANHTLYVALHDASEISEINTQTLTETKRFSTSPYPNPTSLVIAGGKLWFSCFQSNGQGCIASDNFGYIVSANLDGTGITNTISGWPFATVLASGGPGNKYLAISDTYQAPPNVDVWDVSGATPTLVSHIHDPDGGTAFVRQMAFDPSGANLLLTAGAPYYVESLSTSTLLSSGEYPTGPYPISVALTANGNFVAGGIDTNSGPDVFVYPAGNTTPVRTFQVGDDNLSGIDHSLAFSPDASKLFAVVADSATGHLAFHVLLGPTIKPAVTSTSLARSATSVRYGSTTNLTVHVNGTAAGTVDLYATPSGGTKQLLTTGALSGGAHTFAVKPSQNTTYSAVLEEGSTYATSTSPDVSVEVAPVLALSTRAHGTGRVQGHRVRKVLFTAGIKPARPNEPLEFVVQRRVHGGWRTDLTEPFPFAATGPLHIIFFTNRHGLFRVQASYPGDSAYTKSKSAWKQFKVKRLG